MMMRATIVLASCFLISASSFAAEPQHAAKMKPVVVALAAVPAHKVVVVRQAAKANAAETPVAEGSLEKFGATGLPQ
jgi:hypothetical protein